MLKEQFKVGKVEKNGCEISQLSKLKGLCLAFLVLLGTIGQYLLMVAGFYWVWIQDVHRGSLMFLLAFGCWVIKFNSKSAFWKLG